jgi:hypothetical protein
MRSVRLAVLACLVLAPRLYGAEEEAKKSLVGRWAPVAKAAAAPAAKSAIAPKGKVKPSRKRPAARAKTATEVPKCLLEFTKDGQVRLEGDISALGGNFRFLKPLKPLADFSMRIGPQDQSLKIRYQFIAADQIEVTADYSRLMEKLSAGGTVTPEKRAELEKEYKPRETLTVAASPRALTLTNDEGQSMTFRRYAGGSLEAAERKRRAAGLREGLKPLEGILRQQGIDPGAPPPGKRASQPQP